MSFIVHLCRSCLSENAGLHLFETVDSDFNMKLCDIFEICTNITLDEHDEKKPQYLCGDCLEKFRVSYSLIKQCQEVEEQLLSKISK